MVEREIIIQHIDDLDHGAKEFLHIVAGYTIFTLHGEMGVGKTTFIKAVCRALGVQENTSSPTFAIINEYAGEKTIYHFDLFRIKSMQELIDIGFEEYLEKDAYIFIEWPELAAPLLESIRQAEIYISVTPDLSRHLRIVLH